MPICCINEYLQVISREDAKRQVPSPVYLHTSLHPTNQIAFSSWITSSLYCYSLHPYFCRRRIPSKNIPPGSLGFPIIGQSLNVLRVMRANTAEKWFKDRAEKYGPVSKLSLFGKPTVFIYGQAANKFVFTSCDDKLDHQQTTSIKMILGDRNILELTGGDHKRVREALMSFLKPESLKQYVGKIDDEVRRHLQLHWNGKEKVTVC